MANKKGTLSARNPQYWKNKGHSEEAAVKLARSRMPGTIEYFEIFKGFPYEDSVKMAKQWNASKALTEENFIKKYGKDEGFRRWNSYREKQAKSNTFEYKKDKYGWTLDEFNQYNKSRSVTLENLIFRHGVERGTEKYNVYVEAQRYSTSLEYFIEKYGEQDGTDRYERFCRLRGHSYESYLERLDGDEALALTELAKFYSTKSSVYSSSAICKKFCKILHQRLSREYDFSVYYDDYTREYYFGIPKYGLAVVDFFVKELDKVVEFYGDYWHCNPTIYNPEHIIKHPNTNGKLVSEVWEHDANRITAIKSVGVDVLVVWERDFMDNPTDVVEKTFNWLVKDYENRKH